MSTMLISRLALGRTGSSSIRAPASTLLRTMSTAEKPLHPLPPFTAETARQKVKAAQDKWSAPNPTENTRSPPTVSPAYTPDSVWRNRDEFFSGREAIEAFLTRKWAKEYNYRLRKELFAFSDNKIAVEFWYEFSETPEGGKWTRVYGIEHWVFAEDGRMKSRQMSGNPVEIKEEERWFKDGVDVNEGEVPRGHISQK